MESIFDVLKSIVYLFTSIFLFLPAWVRVFVGSALLFLLVVIIYKLIRG